MAEIWSKNFLTIGENDYEVGDMIACLRYKSDDMEKEIAEAIIHDITPDSIVVNKNFGKDTKNIIHSMEIYFKNEFQKSKK